MLRLISIVLAVIALGWAAQAWHRGAVSAAIAQAVDSERQSVRAAAAAELAAAQADAHKARAAADAANLEIVYDIQSQRDRARGAAGRAAVQRDSLLNTIAALRGGQGATGPGAPARSLADAAPALADALSECSIRYTAVGAIADEVTVQLLGLQRYVREVVGPVCIAGSSPEATWGPSE